MKKHKANVHNISIQWHTCPQKYCVYRAKHNGDLKRHLTGVHDVGHLLCPYCQKNVYALTEYTDKNKGGVKICRVCYNKVTGKNSRKETQMSEYLDEHFGKEFLISSDKRVYGDACQRYRPDLLYSDPETVLHIECDEFEHMHHNGSYSCDEKRLSDIYDEFPGKNYIVIRWNPDNFEVPEDKVKLSRKDRLKLLLECMRYVQNHKFDTKITIIYMFYSKDNPLIARNIKSHLVYDEEDFTKME